MADHLEWPDYSAAQYDAIRRFISSAVAVAMRGRDRSMQGAVYDSLGIMRRNALYYQHAARYLRWCGAKLDQHLRAKAKGNKRRGTAN